MRLAIIYRPRTTAPREVVPELFQTMADWTARYESRMETMGFFVGGGGSRCSTLMMQLSSSV